MDRHENEILTDNTKISYCEECEFCRFWGNGNDPYSNEYDKTCCDKYPYPGIKPDWVRHNYGDCDYYEPRE